MSPASFMFVSANVRNNVCVKSANLRGQQSNYLLLRKCPALDPRMGRFHLREHLVLAISTHKAQILTRLRQLISKRWRDPRDFNDSEHYNKRKRGFPRCKNL